MAFPDIGHLSDEFKQAIEFVVKAKGIKGRPDGTFDPDSNITRAEAALLDYRQRNWARLIADELRDASVHIVYFTGTGKVGAGSGWWWKPQLILTGRHVVTEAETTAGASLRRLAAKVANLAFRAFPRSARTLSMALSAETASADDIWCRDYGILLKGVAGMIRSDVMNDERPYVHWRKPSINPQDLAVIQVPSGLWERYLKMREEKGLGPQTFLALPPADRKPILGERCVTFGSPFALEATLQEGIVANPLTPQLIANGVYADYFVPSAAINPGNSGGLCVSEDRDVLGMNLLKPFTQTAFGWMGGDNLGYALAHWVISQWLHELKLDLV